MDEKLNRDELMLHLYMMKELLDSGNIEGAKRAINKAIEQAERKDVKSKDED